jgi:very-short-patch-repair endonuclease
MTIDTRLSNSEASPEKMGNIKQMKKILDKMSEDLTDMTRRNTLLNFKKSGSYTFDLEKADSAAVRLLLSGRTVSLNKLFTIGKQVNDDFEDGVDPELEEEQNVRSSYLTTARKVSQKVKEMEEEKGLEVYFLAQHAIRWISEDKNEYLAPLILTPASIVRKGESGYEITVDSSSGSVINPSLIDYLQVNYKAKLDAEALNDEVSEVALSANSKKAQEVLKEIKNYLPKASLVNLQALSVFQFATLPMIQDLRSAEFLQLAFDNEVIQAISGIGGSGTLVADQDPILFDVLDNEPISNMKLVLDADSHQQIAIKTALRGDHLVIQGPPGTGKSQTIANLICELVSHGKTVLFVAEKAAAINAVGNRLDQLDLGHLMLKLHESGGKKKVAYEQLAIAQNFGKKVVDIDRDLRMVENLRALMLMRNAALFKEKTDYGFTIFEMIEASFAVPEPLKEHLSVSDVLPDGVVEKVLANRGQSAENIADELAKKRYLSSEVADSPWRIFRVPSTVPEIEAVRKAEEIAAHFDETLKQVEAIFPKCKSWTLALLAGAVEVAQLRNEIESKFESTISDSAIKEFLEKIAPEEGLSNSSKPGFFEKRRIAKQFARDNQQLVKGNTEKLMKNLLKSRQIFKSLGGNESKFLRNSEFVVTYLPRAKSLVDQSQEFNVSPATTLATLRHAYLVASEFRNDYILSSIWQQCDALLATYGFPELTEVLFGSGITPKKCKDTFISLAAKTRLPSLLNQSESLQLINPGKNSSEFRDLDRDFISGNAQFVARQVAEVAQEAKAEYAESYGVYKRNANKTRNQLSTRELFHEVPEIILGLTPCVAMSPLLVSSLLPRRELFDVVIFDEASQVLPIHAIPSIARGAQLVVAGDKLQLPPTTFFGRSASSSEDIELNDFDSVLDVLSPRMRNCWLLWHYRSQDERLIAVSNEFVYAKHGETLTTFPGANRSETLKFIKVDAPSQSLRSTDQSSSEEIKTVVREVIDHAKKFPKQSLGVIALGAQHANRVDAAIRAAVSKDSSVREFFDEGIREPFFVKNLERVQGDERDRIIITTGYQKNASGRLPQNFGPINQNGGHRRVNVAISRAKQAMTLISSFGSDDIDVSSAKEGVSILHGFFVFMESGGSQLLSGFAEETPQNPFEYSIFERLTNEGLIIEPQFGVSGYRIDFAVKHPKKPGKFVMAIEADGATYHSSNSARDRDRLRQDHLERLGWTFHRIWSTDWFKNPDLEVRKVMKSYEEALSQRPGSKSNRISEVRQIELVEDDKRTPPKRFQIGHIPIDQIHRSFLREIMTWVLESGELLSRDEAVERAFLVTGYSKRGARILRELGNAYDFVS